MDSTYQIQLGTAKNSTSVNVDQYLNIDLTASAKEILDYNQSNQLSVSDLFNSERQASEVYRVYGRVDFMSIINGLIKNYTSVQDFFTHVRLGQELSGLTKNIMTCFDVYLCYPSTGNTFVSGITYVRNYVVATKLSNFEIYKAGFGTNIFSNYIYAFDFNVDFDIDALVDSFGKPYTNFYLYFKFKPATNGHSVAETVSRLTYTGATTSVPYVTHNVGDLLVGDEVTYNMLDFEEALLQNMIYYVDFPYSGVTLEFQYQPFVPVKIRDFQDELITANISGGTENDLNIPSYATKIDNAGNYIWKDLLINGYIDPISGKGVDYPFVNKIHYIFNPIVLPLTPNLNHANTALVFSTIILAPAQLINTSPSDDLNTLGNRCA